MSYSVCTVELACGFLGLQDSQSTNPFSTSQSRACLLLKWFFIFSQVRSLRVGGELLELVDDLFVLFLSSRDILKWYLLATKHHSDEVVELLVQVEDGLFHTLDLLLDLFLLGIYSIKLHFALESFSSCVHFLFQKVYFS